MKKSVLFWILLLAGGIRVFAQVGISSDNSVPDGTAMLDVKSTTRGVLVPRMTAAQRDAISNPANGLLIFCTDNNQYYYNYGTPAAKNWVVIYNPWLSNGTAIYFNAGNVGIGTSAPTAKLEIGTWTNWASPALRFSKSTGKDIRIINDGSGLSIRDFSGTYGNIFNVRTSDDTKRLVVDNSGGVGIGAGTADSSAVLDISSTTKGFLPPRMTMAQISMIAAPANGLIVFCTTDNKFYTYLTASMVWKEISYGSGTIAPSCGYVITKNHVAGTVAPVTKTVTYGTITNLPGETSKCWITSNLGASHVSASVNDTTEASAGWYWQFNRKQGYQYGASRLPASTWIINITESYDWLSANDPCSIELGAAWHVPAYSEWNNLINGGIWEYDMDAWGSGLKLHDAGYLLNTNGNLTSRGTIGQYWSSVMGGSTTAMVLTIGAGTAMTGPNNKTYGFSIRCVKPD